MTRFLRSAVLSSMLMCGVNTTASPQSYTCLPDTATTVIALKNYVTRLVTASDSTLVATRDRYKLPAADASKVTVVTSTNVCASAGAAYHASTTPNGTPPISRALAVIKVGSTRYIVLDPNQLAGEFELQAV